MSIHYWSNFKKRFIRFSKNMKVFGQNWMGVTGSLLLFIIVVLAIIGPNITNYDIKDLTGDDILQPPSRKHIFGTTIYGQDVFTMLITSLRISLAVGIIAGSLCVIIGTTIGVASAYVGGWIDILIMRITDVIIVIPSLPLMLALASIVYKLDESVAFFQWIVSLFSTTPWLIIPMVYILVYWPVSTKLIRGQALSLKQRTFITSAKASGAKSFYIIFRHIMPNVFPLMLTMIITSMRQAILYEAFLSYLGLGDPTAFTLGQMLRDAQNHAALASGSLWLIFPPGIAIALITLSFAFIGMALDEIVNPRLRKR